MNKKYLLKEAQRTLDESDSTAMFCLCQRWILKDAITLLKEQEPITIKQERIDEFYGTVSRCPKCDCVWIMGDVDDMHFCPKCGQAVKWNEIV